MAKRKEPVKRNLITFEADEDIFAMLETAAAELREPKTLFINESLRIALPSTIANHISARTSALDRLKLRMQPEVVSRMQDKKNKSGQ